MSNTKQSQSNIDATLVIEEKNPKDQLLKVLSILSQKRLSYGLRKIILFQDQIIDSQQHALKHYDLECQGVQIIQGVLRNKILGEKMKAFHMIKNHHLFVKLKKLKYDNMNQTQTTRHRVSDPVFLTKENSALNFNHSSTNFGGYSMKPQSSVLSVHSIARIRNSYQSDDKPIIGIKRPSLVFDRSQKNPQNHQNTNTRSNKRFNDEASNYGESISEIMGKLHQINRVGYGSPRANISFMSRYLSATDLYGQSQDSKRLFIMEKLSNLQRDINNLASRGQQYQTKSGNFRNSMSNYQYTY